ncbi:PIN domain-containing protein [Patulibacter sp. NPDC049589]|uniref:PIN domain-containing protein n=1 Tax=Patulibacter sp. NPDC049589 TaxID=3154731 RepID=UPI00341817FF
MIVLDSWALLALLRAEPAAPAVREAIEESGLAVISWVNLGEVAYIAARRVGWGRAEEVVRDAARSLVRAEDPDPNLVMHAAKWKADGGLSYADAFAAATAERHRAPLLTGDPELIALNGRIDVVDLRDAST